MSLVVHLSDLHLVPDAPRQVSILDALVRTLRLEYEAARPESVAVVVTGDVFDSATAAPAQAVDAFLRLHREVVAALGGDAPTIVIPGNHDRRRHGLLGPHKGELFRSLCEAADPRQLFVAGAVPPFLAQVVPGEMHRLPAHLIAYDSTYLPGGLVGAGGTVRLEDLLMAHARLPDDGRPIIILTHHHLIPTPLTDVSSIDSSGTPRVVRWLVGTALPALVSYGDREELTMTALGAGTALSALHTFGRAVLLLHGHKHVPTARLVAGMSEGSGDVLIASAGSAGTRERVHAARHPEAVRLWPSFNLVSLTERHVRVESVSFSTNRATRPCVRSPLAQANIEGPRWRPEPVTFRVRDAESRVEFDEARYTLSPSSSSADLWDLSLERRVELSKGARLRRYVDFVHALPGGVGTGARRRGNHHVELAIGGVTRHFVPDALRRIVGARAGGRDSPMAFEWVGLLCRYGAARAILRLDRANADGLEPFGSVTDLTLGREQPARLQVTPEHWSLTTEETSPRTLLRLYWPLAPC
jgi:3',5'-cyclic AMP phosphodiesterase CpdA